MNGKHVMISAFAVAAALVNSTGWAQESPQPMVWEDANALGSSGNQPARSTYTTHDGSQTTTTQRIFGMSPITTGRIAEERQVLDDRHFGNFSANVRFDDVRGP